MSGPLTGPLTGPLVGLEEHFVTPEVLAAWSDVQAAYPDLAFGPASEGETGRRLLDLGAERRAAMDATGLDVAVLSLTTPGLQNLAPDDALRLQGPTNDRLAEVVRGSGGRFQGLAALATSTPDAAAAELRRAVTALGLDGAMLYGRTRERPLDHPDFSPIFAAAADLRVPLHLHPQSPPPAVRAAYYDGFAPPVAAGLATHGLGWHYDAGLSFVRLVLAGVFDRFPALQVVIGHWGELVLFYLDRLEQLGRAAGLPRSFADYARTHLFVTPSGIRSRRYLRWAAEVVGADRILFATDYPFDPTSTGGAREFLAQAPLTDAARDAIASGTWRQLREGIRR